jgi:23S rRNA G2445 N2-methylase RlmL
VATLLGKATPDKWRQSHRTDAEYRLVEFSGRLEQLALVHAHQLKADVNTQVTVFRVVNAEGETDQVAYLNEHLRAQARMVIETIQFDFKNADKQIKLAIIAELLSAVS